MAPRTLITALALTAIVAAPARTFADDAQKNRRQHDERGQSQQARPAAQARERAVPRTVEPRREEGRNEQIQRSEQVRRNDQIQRNQQIQRSEQVRREELSRRQFDNRRFDNRRFDTRRYGFAQPRIYRPSIVRVIPYRPYVYRPSFSLGVFYGSGGAYPYGYTPRGYFDPIPGHYYGGVRITGAPRDAHVFADGYYVGIVNDFDGVFQHMNLEAGAHHIEIALDGAQGIEFDVYVRPGETTTFRADDAFGRY